MDHESSQGYGTLTCCPNYIARGNLHPQLSNDPTLSSLPLLTTFLKSYSLPYLGLLPSSTSKQVSTNVDGDSLSSSVQEHATSVDAFPPLISEEDQLVEKDTRDRFKRMCEGYFENVCKKLVIEHTVSMIQF